MKIEIDISDLEENILKNDLVDVQEWVKGAIAGKINNCKKRMLAEWQPKFMADPDVTSIPATEEGFVNAIIARTDYMNRPARDADALAKEASREI